MWTLMSRPLEGSHDTKAIPFSSTTVDVCGAQRTMSSATLFSVDPLGMIAWKQAHGGFLRFAWRGTIRPEVFLVVQYVEQCVHTPVASNLAQPQSRG